MLSNIMGYNTYMNVTFKFTKQFPLGENWKFGSNWAQDYETLHLMM